MRARPGSDVVVVPSEDAIRQALCFGWIDGPVRTFDERIGGLWFAPRRPSSGWAATNKARLIELEAAGLLAPAGIRAIEVAKANGSWTILDNAEALREPDDLAAALDADPAARAAWDAFPSSSRKFGIGAVDAAPRTRRPAPRHAHGPYRCGCRRPKETAMMNELEQNLLFGITGVAILGTLMVFVWSYIRNRDK